MNPVLNALHEAPGAGIMYHHFHGATFPRGQGSISADQLADMIDYIGKDRFLPPEDWHTRAREGRLKSGDLCLTFDDGLACQTAVALPVLENYGLRAFWFVCSAPLQGVVQRLEIYRYFRDVSFKTVDEFYAAFEERLRAGPQWPAVRAALADFIPDRYLSEFSFYSDGDRRFRFLRDRVLGPDLYFATMDAMIAAGGLDPIALMRTLFMDDATVRRLHRAGHRVGLHSHSHPTRLEALPLDAQREEYRLNRAHLESVTGAPVRVMSHPCNAYNAETLSFLESMGIEVGFRSNMTPQAQRGPLEYPREDHINLIREMNR